MTYQPAADSPGPDRPATELRPETIDAGVASLREFLFEGYKVFASQHAEIVEAIYVSMRNSQASLSQREDRQSES